MNGMRARLVLLSTAVAAGAAFTAVYGLQTPAMFVVDVAVIAVAVVVAVAALVVS
jgi:hypothetical protein